MGGKISANPTPKFLVGWLQLLIDNAPPTLLTFDQHLSIDVHGTIWAVSHLHINLEGDGKYVFY